MGNDVSTISWVCVQVWSKAEHFRWGFGRLATSGEEAAVASKNAELGFLETFLCLSVSEWGVVFGERDRNGGFLDHTGGNWRFQLNKDTRVCQPFQVHGDRSLRREHREDHDVLRLAIHPGS